MSRGIEFAVTENGRSLIGTAIGQQKTILFTSAQVGTGLVADGVSLKTMTSLISPASSSVNMGCSVGKSSVNGSGDAVVTVVYTNAYQTSSMNINEVGLFAKVEGGSPILFGYLTFGANPTFVCESSVTTIVRKFEFVIAFAAGTAVSVEMNPDDLIPRSSISESSAGDIVFEV